MSDPQISQLKSDRLVSEAAERIFADGVLDEIADAAIEDRLDERDAMEDAVRCARLALAVQPDEVQDPSADVANVNAAYVIERDDNARLRAALDKIARLPCQYPDDPDEDSKMALDCVKAQELAHEALNGGDR